MGFTTRALKGSKLTHAELDANFTSGVGLQTGANLDLRSPNVRPFGGGQITVVNGSAAVVGVGTSFLEDADKSGVSWAYGFAFKDAADEWFYAFVDSVTDDTNLTTVNYRNLSVDASDLLAANYPGVSGTYDFYISAYVPGAGGEVSSIGQNIYAPNSDNAVLAGSLIFVDASGNLVVVGRQISSKGSGSVLVGTDITSGGGSNVIIGFGSKADTGVNVVIGKGHSVLGTNQRCVIVAGEGLQLDSAGMLDCVFLGFRNEQIGFTGLTNTTVVKHLLQTEISEYANHAAADSAGIPLGMSYTLAGDRTVYVRK